MAETDVDDLINIIETNDKNAKFPKELPLLPVRDVVIFNDMVLPLFIGRNPSIAAIEDSHNNHDKFIMLAAQKNPYLDNPQEKDLYTIGTVSKILRLVKLPDGRIKALVQGIAKAQIEKFIENESYYKVKVSKIKQKETVSKTSLRTKALMKNIKELCKQLLSYKGELNVDIINILENIPEPNKLANVIASNLKFSVVEAQKILETNDVKKKLEKIHEFLLEKIKLAEMQAKIQSKVSKEINKHQRDYFLREQVKAINKELGKDDNRSKEIEEYEKKIKKAKMSQEAEEEAFKQLKRLETMYSDSPEANTIRTYLDWLSEIPWSKQSKDSFDIRKAQQVLDKEHYGLKKIKDRIIELLSVRKLNPKAKGSIICFLGPPGVGKTSLGKAIASAMKRKFVRFSLGGVRDEAEIRGHRRTYVGAMPGRIIQGLKQTKTNNPVFMLDEIDKLGSDYRGDPSSALLEALDPEQNTNFSDHYINTPFDLSKVMFILTANVTETIPSALYDRMEVIHLPGYTPEEKGEIAKKFLMKRQIKQNGLKAKSLSINNFALNKIITNYTSEAGVRGLEREIEKICRKCARAYAEKKEKSFKITTKNLNKFLGVEKFIPELDKAESQAGLATGLAWTQAGGETIYIEVSLLNGKGELITTGQLGEVMQESAQAALSYARSTLKKYNKKLNFFANKDIHVHVPAGATPKDGPSAGIAIATALLSAVSNKKINNNIAMTGEITLKGRVLPIGGLREKAIGAIKADIKTIIIPEKNKKDLQEIPEKIKKNLNFITVKHMDEVLDVVFSK